MALLITYEDPYLIASNTANSQYENTLWYRSDTFVYFTDTIHGSQSTFGECEIKF